MRYILAILFLLMFMPSVIAQNEFQYNPTRMRHVDLWDMPDALNTDHDDRYVNDDGDSITGNLDISGYLGIGSIWHVYGGFDNADTTLVIAGVDTWTKVTDQAGSLFTGTEADGISLADDVMTIVNGGDYYGHVAMTMSALQGKDYELRIYNNTQAKQMGNKIGATTTGANNYVTLSLPLYLEIDSSDTIVLQIQNITDGTDVILRSSVFYLQYLHD